MPLVMTSGNRSDEPIAYRDDDALSHLNGIADLYLTHNRSIHVRCDDSVVRVVGGATAFLRRSRGYAPQPFKLQTACDRHLLAVGGQFKATFALLQRQPGRGQPSHGRSRPLRGLPRVRARRAALRRTLRSPPAGHRSRSSSRLCQHPLRAGPGGARRGSKQWPCSIIMRTSPVAWPSMV